MALLAGRPFVIEVCVDSVESAVAAQQGGADRVELCDNLLEGGTTPSAGLIEVAREQLAIALNVLIRPHGGDFCYSALELAVMQRDIVRAKAIGVDGVVIGVLTPDGTVDLGRMRELVELARPLSVTFHRAFDMARDPYQALEDLIGLGIERVLTSGQAASAVEGLDLIAELVRQAGDRIIVMPGGGVGRHIDAIAAQGGVHEVHVTGTIDVDSPMRFRNQRVHMGNPLVSPEFSRRVTDPIKIRKMRQAAKAARNA
ncbi:MAG: copper homeostasis protein CutC [Chloroflexota bacterium]|nr:copper homeostasis protein CutC [Chloroflexota bacterium]